MLDDLNLKQLDKDHMLELIYNFPEQCEVALNIARDSIRGLRFHSIMNVVITGLGGSAIGGDLIRMMTTERSMIPISVNRNYDLPGFVDDKTLLIASSYSGNTEETLSAYEQAKAKKAKVIVISTGGELKKRAMADEFPVITIPPGLSPRAALGFSFIPLLVILEEQGIVPRHHFDVTNAIKLLKGLRKELCPEVPEKDNPSKALARKLFGKLPVIYGTTGINDVIATRWKGQINENAKHPAVWNAFPELNHNEIMGYEGDEALLKSMEIIVLRSPMESERIKKRVNITIDIIRDSVSGITEIWPRGEKTIEHMLYQIMYGDYVSAYLAILNHKDPTEIDFINMLKTRMKA